MNLLAEYTPSALSLPVVVDWSSTLQAFLTGVGAAFLLILGLVLAFRITRRLMNKISSTVDDGDGSSGVWSFNPLLNKSDEQLCLYYEEKFREIWDAEDSGNYKLAQDIKDEMEDDIEEFPESEQERFRECQEAAELHAGGY
jgi:hypothetical protein